MLHLEHSLGPAWTLDSTQHHEATLITPTAAGHTYHLTRVIK
jgi:hypothetical protein